MTTKQAWAARQLAQMNRERKALAPPRNWRERRRREQVESRRSARMGRLLRIANPDYLDDLPF